MDQTVRGRQREDTEDERPKQRARFEIEEVADEDLEDLINGANEAIMPTQPKESELVILSLYNTARITALNTHVI